MSVRLRLGFSWESAARQGKTLVEAMNVMTLAWDRPRMADSRRMTTPRIGRQGILKPEGDRRDRATPTLPQIQVLENRGSVADQTCMLARRENLP
jgi:hypothetical protein